jgi:beta-N-acetylhexosaminidase
MLGPVVCDIVGTTLSEIEKRRIAHPLVGMVILFARNYENRTQLEKLCRAIHDIKPGVLIGVDHEGGRVQRFRNGFTEIPAMSAYGRAYRDDPEATARALTAAGFVMASELRTAGVDFTFAPVLDLDWGQSQIIGERSFALDPRVVTRLARALSHGMLMAGMANCGKHFPGHGYAAADTWRCPLTIVRSRALNTLMRNPIHGWASVWRP